ncbi:MAG: hypothetical protein ACRCYO_00935 [Bacteroidia bacterium]
MRVFLLLICSLLAIHSATASELYDSLGRLSIDSTYQITARQLARWNGIEQKLWQAIVKDLRYPEVARESEIETKLLLALTVDTGGNIIAVSKLPCGDSGTNSFVNNNTFRQLQKIIAYTNLKTELKFRPFPGKYTQTYYLPFYIAVAREQTSRQFYRGWMYYQVEAPMQVERHIICNFPEPPTCVIRQAPETKPLNWWQRLVFKPRNRKPKS